MSVVQGLIDFLKDKRHRSRETLFFAGLTILLPNALYIVLSILYCPNRSFFVALLAMTCFLGLIVNRFVFLVLLFAVMTLDALVIVSLYFQMPLTMIFDSLRYAANVSLINSAVYLAILAGLLVSLMLTYLVVQRARAHREKISLVTFLVLVVAFGAADWWVNLSPQETLVAQNNFGERFQPIDDAATLHAGIAGRLDTPGDRNVLIVMVEGLGALASQEYRELIWGPLLGQDVGDAYDVKTGAAVYFGSTTSGEARELCNVNGDYRDFRSRDSVDCLPKQAAEAGYETAAFHAFTGDFFERFDWFPKIGFEQLNFMETNAGLDTDAELDNCGVAFRGLCDTDVARSVEQFLLDREEGRKFAYWLTLNSHKPVPPGEVPARLHCDDGGVFDDVELCRMAEQWLNVSYLVKEIALNENLAETDIVLVGDHHPPLFTRSARKLFQPGRVAWLHLTPKAREHTLTASAPYPKAR
jgi:hypothetical protein